MSIHPLLIAFVTQANQVILGKDHEISLVLCAILAKGHVLLEDVPGMGKTTLVKVVGKLLNLELHRIQCTSDLLPADIIGSSIFDGKQQNFFFSPGPIFSPLVLADELNRASPRTQSAFLQAMEEGSVTVDGKTYALPEPFHLLATQNPKQSVGSYPLPHSQLDRFLMCIKLGFPSEVSEKQLLREGERMNKLISLTPIITKENLIILQNQVTTIHADTTIIDSIYKVLQKSRKDSYGLSPRAGLKFLRAAQSWALLQGRDFVIPEDLQNVANPVLAHRLDEYDARENEIKFQDLLLPLMIR